MEKIPNSCTLFDFVMGGAPLANTELLRHIFREVVRINITLQMYGVCHRDCKPENILYCKNDRSLRLIDFGSAAPVQSEDFHEFQVCVTLRIFCICSVFSVAREPWRSWYPNGFFNGDTMVKRLVYGRWVFASTFFSINSILFVRKWTSSMVDLTCRITASSTKMLITRCDSV